MNSCSNAVESVSYLVAPYRDVNNVLSNPGSSNLTFTNNQTEEEKTVSNLKLHNFKVIKGVTQGNVEFVENNCKMTRYFISQSNDVALIHRDAIGGFFELQFRNGNHDYTVETNNMTEADMATGKTVDLTQRINDFKTQFGADQDFYIYFFCPFIKENSESTDFKVKFNLNSEELAEGAVTTKTQQELEDEMHETNTGLEILRKSDSTSPDLTKERWDKILAEVKKSGSQSIIESLMASSPSNYYSVIERNLRLQIGNDDAPDVEKVKVLPLNGGMELIKLESNDTDYYLRSDQEVTGYYTSNQFKDSDVIEFNNKKLNEELDFDSTSTTYTVYVLLYSVANAEHMGQDQGSLARSSSQRILETSYDGTNLYFSKNKMNDEFISSAKVDTWQWILIILGIIILLILLIFCLCCCCCKNKDKPQPQRQNSSTGSYYQDTFLKPVIGKLTDDKVKQYYTEDNTPKSGFTNDL